MYMRHLPLLERLFPDAQYVHLIRDGRDAALSFLRMPEGTFTRTWAHPDTAAEFACLWRTEVAAARELGQRVGSFRYLEVRYEDLVAGPEAVIRSGSASSPAFPTRPSMLDYAGAVDVSEKPHQQRLLAASDTRRRELADADGRRRTSARSRRSPATCSPRSGTSSRSRVTRSGRREKLALARYRATLGAWNAAVSADAALATLAPAPPSGHDAR